MSAEIINLRQARKARARSEKETTAAGNRAKFGRPKSERDSTTVVESINRRRLDAHRIEPRDDKSDRDPPQK